MKTSLYLSEEEVKKLQEHAYEGEPLTQTLKRLAFTTMEKPTTAKEHIACLVQATKWVVANYKEGELGE